jgi:hypothetical protein
MKKWKKAKLNSEMIWEIWKISSSSSSSSSSSGSSSSHAHLPQSSSTKKRQDL